jgi:hypothetical protein
MPPLLRRRRHSHSGEGEAPPLQLSRLPLSLTPAPLQHSQLYQLQMEVQGRYRAGQMERPRPQVPTAMPVGRHASLVSSARPRQLRRSSSALMEQQ